MKRRIILILISLAGLALIWAGTGGYVKDGLFYGQMETEAEKAEEIDFEALRRINPDIAAWIRLKDSKINYPVVRGEDNYKYLSTRFDGAASDAGCLFIDAFTENPFLDFLTIIYGHHMRDGSMFAGLDKFSDPVYGKKHPRFEIITPEEKYNMEVIGYFPVKADSFLYDLNVSAEEERKAYIEKLHASAKYELADVTEEDRLVLLSTCAYTAKNARTVVMGKLSKEKAGRP